MPISYDTAPWSPNVSPAGVGFVGDYFGLRSRGGFPRAGASWSPSEAVGSWQEDLEFSDPQEACISPDSRAQTALCWRWARIMAWQKPTTPVEQAVPPARDSSRVMAPGGLGWDRAGPPGWSAACSRLPLSEAWVWKTPPAIPSRLSGSAPLD
ncbi:uncharacterized protein LOC116418627 [Piliocolobus tephrosceles]|uniref:uncharacterized protein LOC116418627 n=1 Tax=Piliocolobus tephrosceles TaxID=591936 RepID=UPI0013012690|nr:uncharacterized protein LOC116418627 [Piliocolobus tephrosceles]